MTLDTWEHTQEFLVRYVFLLDLYLLVDTLGAVILYVDVRGP